MPPFFLSALLKSPNYNKVNHEILILVALSPVEDYGAVYIAWMCTAPYNNKLIAETPRYVGVGGHLFAIA